MRSRNLFFALFALTACQSDLPVAALSVGSGPHQGIEKSARGTCVELVPMKDNTLRAYVADDAGLPMKAQGEVKAKLTAPSFADAEVLLVPAPDGAYYVGTLPEGVPAAPVDVVLLFPQGVTIEYADVPLVTGVVLTPVEAAPVKVGAAPTRGAKSAAPGKPKVDVVPVDFAPPHKGTVSRVGDNLIEVAIAPKGEVQAYVYELDGDPVPIINVKIPAIEVLYAGKTYKVKLASAPGQPYLTGKLNAAVTIPASAEIEIRCIEPIVIFDVIYEPAVVIFPVLVLIEPVVVIILPAVEIVHHSHHKHKKHKHKKYKH